MPVRGTATSTFVTLMTGIAMQVLTLITGALTARLLGVEGRGAFAACTMLPSIVLMLGNLGGPISLTYFAAKRPESLARFTRQALVTGIIGGAILALILALLYPAFLRNYPGMFLAAAIPACIAIPFQLSSSQLNAVTQGSGRLIQFNLTRLLGPLVYCLVIAACFIAGIDRLDVLLWAPTIAAFAVFAAAAIYRRPFNAEPVTRDQVRETYSYGLRAHLGNITALDSLRIDLLLIVVFLSPSDAGLYAVAIAIASAVRAQASTIGYVAVPTIARNQDRARAIEVARRFFLGTTAIIIALAAILGVVLHEALSLVYGPDFTAAATTTRILLVAMVFAAMRQSLGDVSRALGYPGIASIAELWSWAAAAAFLPILIPLSGLSGAATSVLIAYTVSFVVTGVLMERRGIPPIALVWPGWTPRAVDEVEELPPATSARGEVGHRPWVGPALALTIALASGPLVVRLSPLYLIVLCVGIVFAILAFRYRRWINTIPRAFTREPIAERDTQAGQDSEAAFAVPRLLYYVGLVLSGILIVRPVLGFTASDWVFYAALGAAALEYMLLKRGRGGFMPQLLLTGLAIFAVGAMLSSLGSPAPIGSLLVTAKFFYL
ncbi:MAG: oligosaccharide flippase family protein, partial [Thermomicrobiales bacterium]